MGWTERNTPRHLFDLYRARSREGMSSVVSTGTVQLVSSMKVCNKGSECRREGF